MFTDFRIFEKFQICFRKFDWKKDTRHSSLEFFVKSRQNFRKNRRKNAKFDAENEKTGNSLFIREKMLTIFGWHFEIWAVQKNVNLVDLVNQEIIPMKRLSSFMILCNVVEAIGQASRVRLRSSSDCRSSRTCSASRSRRASTSTSRSTRSARG